MTLVSAITLSVNGTPVVIKYNGPDLVAEFDERGTGKFISYKIGHCGLGLNATVQETAENIVGEVVGHGNHKSVERGAKTVYNCLKVFFPNAY